MGTANLLIIRIPVLIEMQVVLEKTLLNVSHWFCFKTNKRMSD